MNRIIIAIVVVVLILTFGILNEVYIHNSFNEISVRCVEIRKHIEVHDYETAKTLAKDSVEWWNKRRNVLEFTCPHNEIKDFIELNGGTTSESVSKKTDVVIVGISAGSKETKAKELNITIWNEEKIKQIMKEE